MRFPFRTASLVSVALVAASCTDFDTTRTPPKRGSVGEEVFALLCDRVGAQALREDLTGASFKNVCHKSESGKFADKLDEALLPATGGDSTDSSGKRVTAEKQKEWRTYAIARMNALIRHRAEIILALDTAIPAAAKVRTKDLGNPDPTKTCNVPEKDQEQSLASAIEAMLGKTGPLYVDGTLPNGTEALAKLFDAFKSDPDARKAYARVSGRDGYRPFGRALAGLGATMAYPRMRDTMAASLKVISPDADPFAPNPKLDAEGRKIPTPGAGYAAFATLLEAAQYEFLAVKADAPAGPPVIIVDAQSGYPRPDRPRDNSEILRALLLTEDPALGPSTSHFTVRRDGRGFARLAGGAVVAPFVDGNGDGFPDTDDSGHLLLEGGGLAPTPFLLAGETPVQRDVFGRALGATPDAFLYDYVDASHTALGQIFVDSRPLFDPGDGRSGALDIAGGLSIAFGARDGKAKTVKKYETGQVTYDAFHPGESPMVDLVHAIGQVVGDENGDDVLALARILMGDKLQDVARLTGAVLDAKNKANTHDEAQLVPTSTLWDEQLDVMVKISREPGLLEGVLTALGDPATGNIGAIMAKYAQNKDYIGYDKSNINGPAYNVTTKSLAEMRTPVDRTLPLTGENRSAMQRFIQLIADTSNVTACNRESAKVNAVFAGIHIALPLKGSGIDPYKECSIFKIDNLAAFYLDSIVSDLIQEKALRDGKKDYRGSIFIRDKMVREGLFAGVGKATVQLMKDSSGLTSWYLGKKLNGDGTLSDVGDGDNTDLRPKPQMLNRMVFFDLVNDSPNDGDTNYQTNLFLKDLQGPNVGTAVCPERLIDDPCQGKGADCGPADAAAVASDGKVHGLRNCPAGDWLAERGKYTLFTWENFGFYAAMRPLLWEFVKRNREDLFIDLTIAIARHYANADATQSECRQNDGKPCIRDNAVSYEPTIADVMATDVLPALGQLSKTLQGMQIKHCEAIDAAGACTKTTTLTGVDVVARATRGTLDPEIAKKVGLKDRRGNVTALRNDGATNPQVTPAYLMTTALSAVDQAFASYIQEHPDDRDRQKQWRAARSTLVDTLMAVDGTASGAKFKSPVLQKIGPVLVDIVRAQLHAHCPKSFAPPYERCAWARDELAAHFGEAIGGPLVSMGVDVLDAIRKDPEAKREFNALQYALFDPANPDDSLSAIATAIVDLLEMQHDDQDLVPLLHVLGKSLVPSKRDANGVVLEAGLVDAQITLMAKLAARVYDTEGKELCSRELDPTAAFPVVVKNMLRPMEDGRTPLELLMDAIADINKVDPKAPIATLSDADYDHISVEMLDFFRDPERGLEQVYTVMKNGFVRE